MSWDSFLTRRWNVAITVAQGVPTFLFIGFGLLTPFGGTFGGMSALSLLGAFF